MRTHTFRGRGRPAPECCPLHRAQRTTTRANPCTDGDAPQRLQSRLPAGKSFVRLVLCVYTFYTGCAPVFVECGRILRLVGAAGPSILEDILQRNTRCARHTQHSQPRLEQSSETAGVPDIWPLADCDALQLSTDFRTRLNSASSVRRGATLESQRIQWHEQLLSAGHRSCP
eukprot:COSAG01_NODE_15232_length_1358_cov_43.629071_1_plen_172_part_00